MVGSLEDGAACDGAVCACEKNGVCCRSRPPARSGFPLSWALGWARSRRQAGCCQNDLCSSLLLCVLSVGTAASQTRPPTPLFFGTATCFLAWSWFPINDSSAWSAHVILRSQGQHTLLYIPTVGYSTRPRAACVPLDVPGDMQLRSREGWLPADADALSESATEKGKYTPLLHHWSAVEMTHSRFGITLVSLV